MTVFDSLDDKQDNKTVVQTVVSFNALERTAIRLFPQDFHRSLAKSGPIGIRDSSKVQGIWSGANGCSLHMCASTCMYGCKCVVCRECLESESLSTLVPIP